ncbi:MAG: serine hydrolase domain-containing protein [Lachnospiraceae bacterium]|nr:serine hydrolase domain-containing protein [Lachnospiraceae bacterium]
MEKINISKDKLNRIQNFLNKTIEDKVVAGASCLVLKSGEELGYYEAGLRDVERKLPITRDTIFRMFSMSKPITSIAVMQLMENGLIDLGDPVSQYLPGFKNQRCYKDGKITSVTEEMTIKNLLDMTSGLCYPGENNDTEKITSDFVNEAGKKLHTPDEMTTYDLMNELGKIPLAFEPGEKWNYSFSADVLGAIVEVASGMKYSEYLRKNIFEPLEMFDTDFYVPADKQERLARAYDTDGVEFKEFTGENLLIQSRMEERPKFESGGAGLSSTIDDYSKICTMLLNNGEYKGKRILHPETIRFMTMGSLNERQRSCIGNWNYLNGYTYGNLLRVLKYPGEAVSIGVQGEYGWDGWLGVYVSNIPEYDMTILYMQQKPNTGTTDVVNKLRNIIFSSIYKENA